jgi:hypothetical protein
METTLVVFLLRVKSSYIRNSEADATDSEFDTVQFYASDNVAWRIKTYAEDQDVHVWSLGPVEDLVEIARSNTEKHYGDVLAEGYILRSSDGLDGIRRELLDRGLDAHLEVSNAGFAFWTPTETSYRSKSTPGNA